MASSIFDWWRQRYPEQAQFSDAQLAVAILNNNPNAWATHPELNQYRDTYQRIKDRENGAAFDRQTVQGFQQAMEKPEEERGIFATYLNDPRKRGILMSKQADIVTSFSGVNKEFTREDAENLIKIKQELDDLEVSEHFKEFQEADGFLNAWGEFWGLKETPAILAEVTTESLSALLHNGWKKIGAGAAAGAGTALAAGQLGPQAAAPEEIITVPAGALWGAAGGMGKTSYDLSASSKFMETIEATVGRDIMDDPQALFDSLNDPETLKKARSKAFKYGLPVALFDTMSMGLAGRGVKIGEKIASAAGSRAAAPRLAQEGLLNRAARLGYLGTEKVAPYAAGTAFQGTLGASGDLFGQLYSEGRVDDWKSVFLEGIAEFGMAPFEITASNLTKDMSPEYARAIQDRIKDRYRSNMTLDQVHAGFDQQVKEGVITEEGAEIAKGLATEAYETYNNEGVDAIPPSSQGAEVKIGRERALKELNTAIKNEQRRQEGTYAVRRSQESESIPTTSTILGTRAKIQRYTTASEEDKATMLDRGDVEIGQFTPQEVDKRVRSGKGIVAQDFVTPEGTAKSVEKKQDLEEARVKNVLEGAREDGVYESFDQLKDPLAASELLSGNREFADDVNSGLNDPDTAEMSTSEIIRETLGATKHEGLPDVNRERVEAIAAYYELNPDFLDQQANLDAGANPFAEEQLDFFSEQERKARAAEPAKREIGAAKINPVGFISHSEAGPVTEQILEAEEAKYFDAPQVDTRRRGQKELFEQAREDSPELFEAKGPAQQIADELDRIESRNRQLAGIDRGLTGTPLGEGEAIDARTPIQTTKKGQLDPSQSAIFSLDTSQFTVDELGAFAVPVKVSRKGREDEAFSLVEGWRRYGTKLASEWKYTYGDKAAQWAWESFTKAVLLAKGRVDAEKARAAARGVEPDLAKKGLYKEFSGFTVMHNAFRDLSRRARKEKEVMGSQILTSKKKVALGGAGWELATRPEGTLTVRQERELQRFEDAESIYTELGESYLPEASRAADDIISTNPDLNRQIDESNRTPAEVARMEKARDDLTEFIAQFNSLIDFELGIETKSPVEDISSTGLSRRLFREVLMPALAKSIERENSKKPEYKKLIRERESLSSELRRLDKRIDDISGNKLVQYITRYNSYATQIKASDLYSDSEIQSNPSLTPDTVITHHSVVEGVYEILARENILPKNANIEIDVKLGERTVRRKAKEHIAELESRRKIVSNALFDLGVKVRAAEEAMSGSTRNVDYDGIRAGIAEIYKSVNQSRELQNFQELSGAPKQTKTQYYVKNSRRGGMRVATQKEHAGFGGEKATKPIYGSAKAGMYTNYYLREKLNLLQRKVTQSFNQATLYSAIGNQKQFMDASRDAQFAETVRGTEPDLFNQGVRFFKEDKLSGSFSEAFDHIYSQLNPEEMAFADKFLPFLKLAGAKAALNTKVILVELNSSDGAAPPAFYNTVFDQIVIDPNRLRNSPFTAFKVLLEEYFHSLTSGALLLDSNKGMKKRLTKMLEKIRAEVKKRGGYEAVGMKSGYPLLNEHEMIAHALFDPAFESLLRTIAPTEKTNKFTDFFDQVLDAIKKLLGLNKSHDNILQEVREMAFNLMHQKEVMTSRTGGRFGVYNALMSGGGDRIVTIKHYDTGKYDEHVWIANNPRSGVRIHSDDKHYSYIPPDTRTKEFFDAVKKGIKEEASLSEFAETPFAAAFHGSPRSEKIDKLSTDYIGTGARGASYGWGIYSSSKEDIAATFKEEGGRGYKVELAPLDDEYLLWDESLLNQTKKVQQSLEKIENDLGELLPVNLNSGAQIYRTIEEMLATKMRREGDFQTRPDKAASLMLLKHGIRGNKFSAAGEINYVIFDDSDIEITGSFAEPIPEKTEGELAKDKIRRSIEPIERKEGMVRSEMSLWDKFKEQLVTKSQILNVFQDMIMERNNIAGKTRVTLAEMHELQAGSPVKADLRVSKFREDMQALLGKDPEQLQKFNEYITNLRIQDRLKNPLAEEDLARLETLNGYIDLEGNFVVPEEELAAGRTTEDIKHEFIALVDKTKRVGDFKDRSDVPTLVKGVEALMEEINDPEILRYQRNADGNIMYNVDGPLFEGKFVEAAELYHSHFQSALFDMYNSGLITSRAYTDMVNSSSFYAPFFVLKYFNRNPEDTFGSYIKGIQDEDWGILRPMDAAEYKLYNTQLRIDRNQMLLKMKDFKDDFDPDGNFITISNEQYTSADLDSVKFYDRGNVRYMVMDDDVARLLNSFDPVSTSTTYMTTKLAGDIFKLGATGMNLFFQAGNFLMFDPIRLLTTSRAGLRAKDKGLSPIVLGMQYLKAMMASSWANLTPNSVKNLVREYAPNQIDQLETLYSEFVNSGAAGSTIAEYFDKATQIKDPLARGNNARRNPVSNAILWGNAKASSVGKTLEQTAKMVGMQRMKIFEGLDVLEQKIQDEKDPQKLAALQKEAQEVSDQIAVEIRNFAGSPDFIRKGKFTDSEALNVIFMFFNARIQGVERDLSRMLQIFSPKGDKAEAMKVMMKVSAFAAMPTMLAWSMNRRYKDDYDEVSDEEKKRYFMIPLDEMFEHPYIEGKMVRDYIRVPRRESFGLFSYTLEKGLDFFYEKDPAAVNELLGFWLESTMPVNIAGLTEGDLLKAGESVGSSLNPLLKAPAELIGNRNFFRHKPLVPQSLADADAKEQYYESTPDVYKALGGMTGLGALRTKHLLESLTAGGITQFFPNKDVGIPSEAGVPALGRTIASTPLVSRLARSSYLAESDLQEIMDDSDQLSATDRVIRRRFVDRWFSDTRGMTIQDRVRHIPPATNHSEKLRNDMIIKRLRMMALGLEPDEARLAGMPVDARADVIFNQMQNKTPAEVKVYLTDLASKRIITQGVANVLMERMASRGEDIYDYTAEPVR
tara:strand:- start:17473 stop:26175 length:8703 start_codon:yes stop_codon:yes gene_type:complete